MDCSRGSAHLTPTGQVLDGGHEGDHAHPHPAVLKLVVHRQHLCVSQLGCRPGEPLLRVVPGPSAGMSWSKLAPFVTGTGESDGLNAPSEPLRAPPKPNWMRNTCCQTALLG